MRFFPVFFFFPQSTHVKATWDASKQRQQPQKKLYTNNFFSLLLLFSQIDFVHYFIIVSSFFSRTRCFIFARCMSAARVSVFIVSWLKTNQKRLLCSLTHTSVERSRFFETKKKIILHLHFERAFAVFFSFFSRAVSLFLIELRKYTFAAAVFAV